MVKSILLCVTLLAYFGALVVSQDAHAQNAVHPSNKGRVVTTHRSDGAIFPATTQTSRAQRARQTSVSGSRQALPARGTWQNTVEPLSGGTFVAPSGDVFDNKDATLVQPYVAVQPSLQFRKQISNRKNSNLQ
jgi:hypothetical protein